MQVQNAINTAVLYIWNQETDACFWCKWKWLIEKLYRCCLNSILFHVNHGITLPTHLACRILYVQSLTLLPATKVNPRTILVTKESRIVFSLKIVFEVSCEKIKASCSSVFINTFSLSQSNYTRVRPMYLSKFYFPWVRSFAVTNSFCSLFHLSSVSSLNNRERTGKILDGEITMYAILIYALLCLIL